MIPHASADQDEQLELFDTAPYACAAESAHEGPVSQPDPDLQLRTTDQLAALLHVAASTVRRRVKQGSWPARIDGSLVRFAHSDIEAIVASMSTNKR